MNREVAVRAAKLLAPLLIAFVLLGLRHDYLQREQARSNLQQLLRTLVWMTEPAVSGLSEPSLSWLHHYPRVISAELLNPDGQRLALHENPPLSRGAPAFEESLPVDDRGARVHLLAELPSLASSLGPASLMACFVFLLLWPQVRGREDAPQENAQQSLIPPESPKKSGETSKVASFRGLILELSPDLKILSVGRGIKPLGYHPEELLGRPISTFLEGFEPSLPDKTSPLAARDGKRLDSTFSSVAVRNEQGEVEKVVVTIQDSLSNSGERLAHRVRHLERLYQALCAHAQELIVLVGPDNRILYSNPRFCEAFQRDREDLLGLDLLELIDPNQRLLWHNSISAALEGEAFTESDFQLETPSGTRTFLGTFHPILGETDDLPALMGIFRDITEKIQINEELRVAEERFQHSQKMEAVGRLAGGVAHDFNNLLTVIFGNLGFLEEHLVPGSEQQDCLDELKMAAERAASLTTQLLLFTRKQPARREVVAGQEVVKTIARLAQRILGEKIDLQLTQSASRDHILVESGHLDQVIMNLLVNARDALPGGGTVKISTRDRALEDSELQQLPSGSYFEVTVEDNGTGISPEVLPKIFEPYFTTKELGAGTGLGLSTVYGIVKKAGGDLQVESSLGRGSKFTILLPLAAPAPVSQLRPKQGLQGGGRGERVLLVEDEASVRKAVESILSKGGYHVTTASNGKEALALIRSGPAFAILVTDLVLPGISGADLAAEYVAGGGECPVLFVSGYPAETLDNKEVLKNSSFLAKPFTASELCIQVRKLLDASSSRA